MAGSWTVRKATEADADGIAEAHMALIRELGPTAYDATVVDSWGEPRDGERYRRMMAAGGQTFVAVREGGRIEGFSSAGYDGHGTHLAVYVRGTAARKGIGAELLRRAEDALREAGATELTIDASLNAVPFYLRQGFESLGEQDHKLSTGVVMRCVQMRKPL